MRTIIRKAKNKENPYAQIARTAAQDKQLSWKATGLLVYLLSLPDNWQIHLADLANRKKDGIKATRTALKELINAGYVKGKPRRAEDNRFTGYEYLVYEATAVAPAFEAVRPNIYEQQKFIRGERGNFNDLGAVAK